MAPQPTPDASGHAWPPALAAERPFLLRLARLQTGHDDEAEDIVQDTLIAAAAAWPSWSGAVPVRAWLTGIMRHKALDLYRRRRRQGGGRQVLPDDANPVPAGQFTDQGQWDPDTFDATPGPADAAGQRQLLAILELCLLALPGESGRIFLLREYLGFDMTDISTDTGHTPGHVRVILHRARLRLRSCLMRGWGDTR